MTPIGQDSLCYCIGGACIMIPMPNQILCQNVFRGKDFSVTWLLSVPCQPACHRVSRPCHGGRIPAKGVSPMSVVVGSPAVARSVPCRFAMFRDVSYRFAMYRHVPRCTAMFRPCHRCAMVSVRQQDACHGFGLPRGCRFPAVWRVLHAGWYNLSPWTKKGQENAPPAPIKNQKCL